MSVTPIADEALPDDADEALPDDADEALPDDADEALPDDADEALPDDADEASPNGADEDSYVSFDEDPPMAEEVQELGRAGVMMMKRWLEATTHIQLSYDIYDFSNQCIVPYIGGRKRFDLSGRYVTGDKAPVYVECKRYRSAGGQAKEFDEFLRIAYSSRLAEIAYSGRDRGTRFIWVTTHPFSQTKWSGLDTHQYLRTALEAKPECLGGSEIDEGRLRDVSSRVMVLVFNPKQEGLSLTSDELRTVQNALRRG